MKFKNYSNNVVLIRLEYLIFRDNILTFILLTNTEIKSSLNFQHLLKAVLEMNHMQMQDLIDYSDPDEGGENPAPDSLMRVR